MSAGSPISCSSSRTLGVPSRGALTSRMPSSRGMLRVAMMRQGAPPPLVGVAQRHQRQAQLDAVAVGQALHGGVEPRSRARSPPPFGAGEEHAVGHHTGGADAHELERRGARPSGRSAPRRSPGRARPCRGAHQRRTDLLGRGSQARMPTTSACPRSPAAAWCGSLRAPAGGPAAGIARRPRAAARRPRRHRRAGRRCAAAPSRRQGRKACRLRRRIGHAEQRGQQGARQCGERLHCPGGVCAGRARQHAVEQGVGQQPISLATTPICQGMTR